MLVCPAVAATRMRTNTRHDVNYTEMIGVKCFSPNLFLIRFVMLAKDTLPLPLRVEKPILRRHYYDLFLLHLSRLYYVRFRLWLMQNNFERAEFNHGRKRVAIISDAASAGVSLHANRIYTLNTRRRYCRSADTAICQMFVFSHARSNSLFTWVSFSCSNVCHHLCLTSKVTLVFVFTAPREVGILHSNVASNRHA